MDDRLVSPVLMWAIIFSGAAVVIYSLPATRLYTPGIIHKAIFLTTLGYWAAMFSLSLWHNRTAAGSAKDVVKVVDEGPYALVRHPIYSSDIVFAWGIVAAHPEARFAASAAWLTAVMVRWAYLEESHLKARLRGAYAEYQGKTPMLLPDFRPAAVRRALGLR